MLRVGAGRSHEASVCGGSTRALGGDLRQPSISSAHQKAASAFLLFAFLWWLWTLASLVGSLRPGGAPIQQRLLYVLAFDVCGLVAIAVYFKTWSLLWQVPLQALAAVFLLEGVSALVKLAFERPQALISPLGLWYGGLVVAGVTAALLMKRLQVQFLGGHHRHLTTRSSRP